MPQKDIVMFSFLILISEFVYFLRKGDKVTKTYDEMNCYSVRESIKVKQIRHHLKEWKSSENKWFGNFIFEMWIPFLNVIPIYCIFFSLGMWHDGFHHAVLCPDRTFLMSGYSVGGPRSLIWSQCSRQAMNQFIRYQHY